MTSIQEKINSDWKEAMKQRDPKKEVLTLIRTELKNKAIASRTGEGHVTEVNDENALSVMSKMAKQRKESAASFKTGGRNDLAEKELSELLVIESYLPAQLTDQEIEEIVKAAVLELNATSMKEMGKVMGLVMSRVKQRADGNRIQGVVKKAFANM